MHSATASPQEAPQDKEGRPICLWVVDDSEPDQYLLRRSLRSAGGAVEIRSFYSAERALEALEAGETPSLVLLDLNMPGIGGLGFLKTRFERSLLHVPVVVFSSSNDRDEIRESYRCGATSYLKKPEDLAQFRALSSTLFDYWFRWAELP